MAGLDLRFGPEPDVVCVSREYVDELYARDAERLLLRARCEMLEERLADVERELREERGQSHAR